MNSVASEELRKVIRMVGLLMEMGNFAEARSSLTALPPMSQLHPEALRVSLNLYIQAGQFEAARHLAEMLSRSNPGDLAYALAYAHLLHREGENGKACAVLIPLRQTFPKSHELVYALACYSFAAGDTDSARKFFSEAIELGAVPEDDVLIENPVSPRFPLGAAPSKPNRN